MDRLAPERLSSHELSPMPAQPLGWFQEQIDWTDAAHIWNPQKVQQLQARGEYQSIFATSLWGPFGNKQESSPILANDCDNFNDPGTIGYNQEFCEPNSDPDEIISLTPPVGGSGEIEYIWLRKIGNGEWLTIPGSTGASYDPGPLSQPTFFRRCARRAHARGRPSRGSTPVDTRTVPSAYTQTSAPDE